MHWNSEIQWGQSYTLGSGTSLALPDSSSSNLITMNSPWGWGIPVLVSSVVSLTSWLEGGSWPMVGSPSIDGIKMKISCGVDMWLQPIFHTSFVETES